METLQKLKKHYDHVLVGYNLISISFASELAKQNKSFCLVDSKHFGSSPFKKISSLGKDVYARVPFNAGNEQSLSDLDQETLEEVKILETTPVTFDKGNFKSFLGFGDTKVEAMDAAMAYCQTSHIMTSLTPEFFWEEHAPLVEKHVFLDQEITDLHFEESTVNQITLNGKFQLQGKHFYFFDHFPFLFEKIGPQAKKVASQFAKTDWFSSVNLVIHHKEEPETFELDQVYLLKGSKEQPCIGLFSRVGGELISRWESFFPVELTADSESTGACLKEIKKQLKRAFSIPDTSTNPEHILIQNQIFSDLSKTGIVSGKVNNFNNLEVHSPLFSQRNGWAFELLTGQQISVDIETAEKSDEAPRIEVAAPQAPC